MDRFQRGKIYAIRAVGSDMVYIGSTISTLTHRISCHRADFRRYQAGKGKYITSIKLMELEGHYIELVENYPCADRNELNRREGQIMRETEGCINRCIAGRTPVEYRRDNKEAIVIRKKQFYQDNKEQISIQNGQYRHDNKEAIAIQQKQYRQENKEAIAIQQKQKFNCECGGKYSNRNKAKHLRTQKHQAFINA